jgi:hypothetical protein
MLEAGNWGGRRGQVFIDAACKLCSNTDFRVVNKTLINVLDSTASSQLSLGGILFVGARTTDRRPTIPALRDLRHQLPGLIIVLAAPRNEADAVPLSRWCRAGVDEFICLDTTGSLGEVKRLIDARRRAPPPVKELEQLRSEWPSSWVREAVLHAWRNTYKHMSVPEWASRFGRSVRTFREDVRDYGFPSPQNDSSIGRWLHLAELCDMEVAGGAERARRLGFADVTEMRQHKWRFKARVECGHGASRIRDALCQADPSTRHRQGPH